MARQVFIPETEPTFLKAGNPAKALAKAVDQADPLGLPQPVIPKPTSAPQDGSGLLVFDGQSLSVETTAVIASKGAAPVVVTTELEGRRSVTDLDPAPLGTCSVPFVVTGNAQFVHDVIVARARAGQVLRVYGPMVGPFPQGAVWAFASMPEPEVLYPMLPDGRLRAFRMVLELSEWRPAASLKPVTGSRTGTDGPRKKAAAIPDRRNVARNVENIRAAFR